MAKTTADVLFDRLVSWGVDVIFGLPGDGINGFMEGLRKLRERIRFVQVRHEEGAAFMACGYAKFTGRLGVCIATSGPGAIHLLNGLYDAKMDSTPVLAITGQTYHDMMGMHYQQEVNLLGLFEDVTVFNQQINGPQHAHSLVDAACRTALSRKGVAHLNCPNDWQELTEEESSDMMVKGHTVRGLEAAVRGSSGRVDQGSRRHSQRRQEDGHHGGAGGTPRRRHGGEDGRYPGARHRQGTPGQGRGSRRQSIHHRRAGAAGHRPFREGDGGMR